MSLHTISVLVEDKPGVLTRVAGLFSARGFNIDSLAVGPTEAEGLSRMTIVVNVESKSLEQVTKQLNKLINVIKILEHEPGTAVERELMLAKVRAKGDARARIMEIAEVFRVSIVDVTKTTLTVEASGKPEKLEALRELLSEYGIVELSRTGRIALARGDRGIREKGGLRMAKAAGAEDASEWTAAASSRTRTRRGDEMATIYHEQDTDVSALAGQKIAVLGFGSQGHAHAQNLKDSGHDVRVGLRPGSSSRAKAEEAGLRVVDTGGGGRRGRRRDGPAARHLAREGLRGGRSRPHLNAGDMLMFAHGFSIHFGTVTPPADVDVTMIAPKGPGHLVRRTYEEGIGTPALVAVQQDATGKAQAAGARLRRTGSARPAPGIIETTFKEETETDLFGEQTVLCGGHLGADPVRVRHAGRGRLPAGDRVLRVPARDEADRRPDLRGRAVVDALLRSPTPPSGATTRAARASWIDDGTRETMRPSRSPRSRTARSRSAGSPRPTAASRSSSRSVARRGPPSSKTSDGSCGR